MTNIFRKGSQFSISAPLAIMVGLLLMISMFSCTSASKVRYFNNLSDSQLVKLPYLQKPEAVIMPDDILDIRIGGANETTVGIINGYTGTTTATSSNYLVDVRGDIEFPLIGKVKAAGLTREQLKEELTQKAAKYLKDPVVVIRFVSFKFTVLGEVNAPGPYTVNNEKVTILEALGLARDMTQYARRSNVRIIRDSSGRREIGQVNFNDKSVFTSPYYYLQRNDVVYVEPEKSKGQIDQITRIGSITATVLSLIAVSLTIFR